jgi:hypothetical protein
MRNELLDAGPSARERRGTYSEYAQNAFGAMYGRPADDWQKVGNFVVHRGDFAPPPRQSEQRFACAALPYPLSFGSIQRLHSPGGFLLDGKSETRSEQSRNARDDREEDDQELGSEDQGAR